MNTSTLLLDNVQLEKPHFTSVNFSNETIAKFTDSQLFLQHFLEKLKLINTHNYLVTNYETNITSFNSEATNSLNTSTLFNYIQLESISYDINKNEFDWINNINPLDRIYHLRNLPENWDNYGASGFSEEHIERAKKIYLQFIEYSFSLQEQLLDIRPFVAPCSDGSILFEWAGKRFPIRQLEIYIPRDINSNLLYLQSSDNFEDEAEISESCLSILFNWLFGKTR